MVGTISETFVLVTNSNVGRARESGNVVRKIDKLVVVVKSMVNTNVVQTLVVCLLSGSGSSSEVVKVFKLRSW